MQLVKWIATGLLVLPLAEIAAFIVVASLVGFTTALGLVILISLLGVLVLRHAGGGAVTRLRTAAGRSEIRGVALDGPGAGTALGGILMVIPGFITGVLGLLMIMPATRGLARRQRLCGYFTQHPGSPRPAPSTSRRRNGARCLIRKLPPRRSRRKTERAPNGPVAACSTAV